MTAYALQWAERDRESAKELEQWKSKLNSEIDACKINNPVAIDRLKAFLLEEGITGIAEMDYPLRASYEEYLQEEVEETRPYLRAYDQVKIYSVRNEMKTLDGRQRCGWKYENIILYLPYHSDSKIAKDFEAARNTEALVWDFGRRCSEKLKRQIYEVLNFLIEDNRDKNMTRRKLLGLQAFYSYCVQEEIEDIESLTKEQADRFIKETGKDGKSNGRYAGCVSLINQCRKVIFLSHEEINWNAHVWYLDGIHLTPGRIDPSKSHEGISFLDINDPTDMSYAKEFMKYELGVTGQAMSTIYIRFRVIVGLLTYLEEQGENILTCTVKHTDQYIHILQDRQHDAKHFNQKLVDILHFFQFLKVREYIEKMPFKPDYYFEKVIQVHHDRSVEEKAWQEIIQCLPDFPEHLRCMFLHLWSIGLRASEVCTLKGNAYYIQNNETWLQIYQQKMKTYKRIPIPEMLYNIMQVYMKRHQIGSDDYIFQNTKGGACNYSTFRCQMIKECKKHQIQNGEYIFKSHDYRHTIATMFYDNDVSLQSIRDYLGHKYEEMTRQYIDYMPRKLAEANDKYFSKPGRSLAACLRKGGKEFGK